MDVIIFLQIEYDNKIYYLANGSVTLDHVYYPYLNSIPNISVGGEGFSKISTGSVSIIRSDYDPAHPFSEDRYYKLINNPEEIPFRIFSKESESPIFTGNLVLDEITEDQINFLVVEEDYQRSLVYPVLNREGAKKIMNFFIFQPAGTTEYQLMFSAESFELSGQSDVIFERTYAFLSEKNKLDPFLKLDYEISRDNRFIVASEEALMKRLMIADTDDHSRIIGIEDLMYYVREGKTYYTNKKDLLAGNTALALNGMGFALNSSDQIANTPLDQNYKHISEGGTVLYTYADLMGDKMGKGKLWKVPNFPDNEYYIGTPVINPFTFGHITMRDPVIIFGDRLLKRDYQSYAAGDPEMSFEPQSVTAKIDHKNNVKIFDYISGQEYIAPTSASENTTWAHHGDGSGQSYNSNVFDKQTNRWVTISGPGSTSILNGSVVFNKIRFPFIASQTVNKYTAYGSSATKPSSSSYTKLTLTKSSMVRTAVYNSGGTTLTQHPYSNTHRYTWIKQADTTNWVEKWTPTSPATTLLNIWYDLTDPISNQNMFRFAGDGVSFGTTYKTSHTTSAGDQWQRGLPKKFTFARSISFKSVFTDLPTRTYISFDKTDNVSYVSDPDLLEVEAYLEGSLICRWRSDGQYPAFWLHNEPSGASHTGTPYIQWADGEGPVINGVRVLKISASGSAEETYSGVASQEKRYAMQITFINDCYSVEKKETITVNTGTMSLFYGNATSPVKTWTGQARPSTTLTAYTHTSGNHTLTKGIAHMTGGTAREDYRIDDSSTSSGGWSPSSNIADPLNFLNSISATDSRVSISANTVEVTLPNNMYLTGSDNPYAYLQFHHYLWKSSTTTTPATPGQEYIAPTSSYFLDHTREKIYRRSIEGSSISSLGWTEGKDDYAIGTGWSDGRTFPSTIDDVGYHLSQIFIENNIVYESSEKTPITLAPNSRYVSGTKNLFQAIDITNIQKSTDVPADVDSDYYRIYRTDNKYSMRDLTIIRVKQPISTSNPTIHSYTEGTYFLNSKQYFWSSMIIDKLDLTYDNDPKAAYIWLDCYAGAVVEEIICYDSSSATASVIASPDFPDGTPASFVNSIYQIGLPKGTQKIFIKIRNNESDVDENSKKMRGFDAHIYQRIFPIMNSTSSGTSQYAVVGSFNFFKCDSTPLNPSGIYWMESHHLSDLFSAGGTGSSAFTEANDEVAVHSLRNPSIFRGEIEPGVYSPRIFDDGVEIGKVDDLHGEKTKIYLDISDEDFIHLSVVPFGQVAISGRSSNGITLKEFFELVAKEIKIEKEEDSVGSVFLDFYNTEIDITLAPLASEMEIPIYQSSEITVMEMADKVATATNHQFYLENTIDDSSQSTRKLVLVDLNYAFLNDDVRKKLRSHDILQVQIEFGYPIKAFESTLTRNVAYTGLLSQNSQSVMKSVSSKYRVSGSGVGNVEEYDVFAETFEEGKFWLSRRAETESLPKSSVSYHGIDESVRIGMKVAFIDDLRKLNGVMVVQQISFNFENESTEIKGICSFEEIVYE